MIEYKVIDYIVVLHQTYLMHLAFTRIITNLDFNLIYPCYGSSVIHFKIENKSTPLHNIWLSSIF